ncbi:CASP-like protein 4B1 [Alnus glutinosa]|uniref:CASP-like protein 4B1 n=1 Tax=Alnus glutinosa TaxID=3517 RepID=UPI002D7736FC|nr:CASP-like protein 4B1 [Alnus glutinosa]
MSNLDDDTPKQYAGHFPPTVPTAPPVASTDVQNKSPGTTFAVSEIVQRWKREDFMKSGSLALTGLALLFSLLSFIVMAANNHGDGMDFNQYETYRYVLAIAILSTVYTGGKAFRQALELWAGKRMFQQRTSALIGFFGDQIMAYLLISAASSAASLTNLLREAIDGIVGIDTDSSAVAFVDTSSASITMAFLAFFALAMSAMISGYKLSTQSYI